MSGPGDTVPGLSAAHAADAAVRVELARAAQSEDALGGFISVVWPVLRACGVSWVGFYRLLPDGSGMELLAREPGPACSPIGLHGACGRAHLGGRGLVIRCVDALGAGYIACDPRDRSELVLPLAPTPERPYAMVLDLDSHSEGAFEPHDAALLWGWLRAAGLAVGPTPPPMTLL